MSFYRVVPLTDPERADMASGRKKKSPFKSNWSSTLSLLKQECHHLRATDVRLCLGVEARHLRNDGGIRADARIQIPGVILKLKSGADQLAFPCPTFNWWEDNVRAIALAMQALRAVNRYGVREGRQYEGFKALGSGAAAPAKPHPFDVLKRVCSLDQEITFGELDEEWFTRLVRLARNRTHPDRGGSAEAFTEATAAAAEIAELNGWSVP